VTVLPAGELAFAVAGWIAARVAESIAERGTCAVALSGGNTPRPVYAALAAPPFAAAVDWPRVEVFFGDERAVPPDHPDSNYRMAALALLERVRLEPARIHRLQADRPDRDAAARDYERLLPLRLDVVLLGMGPDGHTASLFPGSAAITERSRRVVAVVAPRPPAERLTVTPPVIAGARYVAVVVAGAEKAQLVARALTGPLAPWEVPVQVAPGAFWFLDEPAASRLAPQGGGA
jgi:6-phosphogluconolactonase